MGEGSCGGLAVENKALRGKGVAQSELGFWGKAFLRPRALPDGPSQAEPLGNMLAYVKFKRQRFARNPKDTKSKNFHPQMLARIHTHQEHTSQRKYFEENA